MSRPDPMDPGPANVSCRARALGKSGTFPLRSARELELVGKLWQIQAPSFIFSPGPCSGGHEITVRKATTQGAGRTPREGRASARRSPDAGDQSASEPLDGRPSRRDRPPRTGRPATKRCRGPGAIRHSHAFPIQGRPLGILAVPDELGHPGARAPGFRGILGRLAPNSSPVHRGPVRLGGTFRQNQCYHGCLQTAST